MVCSRPACSAGCGPESTLGWTDPVTLDKEVSVNFEAGDRLVLYTDGVTEAEDSEGEMFEDWRLEKLLIENNRTTAAVLEKTVAETVLTHAQGKLQDGLTLVVVAIG